MPRRAVRPRRGFRCPYVVATALLHGQVRLAAFAPNRLADPRTRELMARITAGVDPELDATFPRQRAARVSIRLRDGRSETLLQPTRKGDPDAPLSDAELDDKFLELAAPVIGDLSAYALLTRLWHIDSVPDLGSPAAA